MPKVLIVCMANVCRSPMAETVARHMSETVAQKTFVFESAAAHAKSIGQPADPRAIRALERRGYKARKHRSRCVKASDFERFDLVLAMDRSNLAELERLCPLEHHHKLKLFMSLAEEAGESWPLEVPDPYYGNPQGFERVLDLCEAAVKGLLRITRG